MKTLLSLLLIIFIAASCKHEPLQSNRRMQLYQVGLNFAKQDITFPANSKFHPEPDYVAYDSFKNEYTVKGSVDTYDSIGQLTRLIWVNRFRTLDNKIWVRTDGRTDLYYYRGVPTEIK